MRFTIFKTGSRALRSRPAVAVYTAGVVAAFFGGVAYASIPGPTGVINACYATKSPHTLRVIDSTQKCPSGTTALNWSAAGRPGPGGVNGIQEFTTSGSWVAPTGITHVMVQVWGAGGGGGGGDAPCVVPADVGAGGGGGGGGYLQAVIAVTSGQTYNVVVGAGGPGGPATMAGSPGGNSGLASVGTYLAAADGGSGGLGGSAASGGAPGVGGSTSATPGISRQGMEGATGGFGCTSTGLGGGDSFSGTMDWWDAAGGNGGSTVGSGQGENGMNGYMILTW
jgi:hypothetical protein